MRCESTTISNLFPTQQPSCSIVGRTLEVCEGADSGGVNGLRTRKVRGTEIDRETERDRGSAGGRGRGVMHLDE